MLINPTKTRNKFCIKKKPKSKGTFKKEENSFNCAVTNCQGNDDCDLVACDKCDKWVCGTCYDVNNSKLKLVMEKCSSIYFLCKDCETVLPPSPCNDTTSLNVSKERVTEKDVLSSLERMKEEKLSKFQDKLHETLTQHETENQVWLDMQINKVIEQQNTYADAINKNLTTVEVVNPRSS